MKDQPVRIISRRDLLKGAGVVGTAALTTPGVAPAAIDGAVAQAREPAVAATAREAYESLSAVEADVLEAVVERLIPSDGNGPGAREARVVHYIDRALGGALASSRPAYAAGLAALDRHSQSSRGRRFAQLSASDQDAVLTEVEAGSVPPGVFAGSPAQFFTMVLNHTRQGMFGDPYYGGNANFAGWELLGYPGVRTMVTAGDQKALEANQLKPNRRSAYDYEAFNKATAHRSVEEHRHGD
jgi:gluconate 2-dehydrogenase gamma chain